MTKCEIKNRYTDAVLFAGEYETLLACLQDAVAKKANLSGANLSDANLSGANLSGAYLGFSVGWDTYCDEVVPALLTAGGKKLEEVATEEHWTCHGWSNCPMAAAFSVDSIEKIPPLYRQAAETFIRFFDAGLIPMPKIAKESGS